VLREYHCFQQLALLTWISKSAGSFFPTLGTLTVEDQAMIGNLVTLAIGDLGLLVFDDFIDKLFDLAAANTDDMVMMAFPVELEYSLATLEMMTRYQAGGLKLGQNTVYGGETDFFTLVTQGLVYILCTLVPDRG